MHLPVVRALSLLLSPHTHIHTQAHTYIHTYTSYHSSQQVDWWERDALACRSPLIAAFVWNRTAEDCALVLLLVGMVCQSQLWYVKSSAVTIFFAYCQNMKPSNKTVNLGFYAYPWDPKEKPEGSMGIP